MYCNNHSQLSFRKLAYWYYFSKTVKAQILGCSMACRLLFFFLVRQTWSEKEPDWKIDGLRKWSSLTAIFPLAICFSFTLDWRRKKNSWLPVRSTWLASSSSSIWNLFPHVPISHAANQSRRSCGIYFSIGYKGQAVSAHKEVKLIVHSAALFCLPTSR